MDVFVFSNIKFIMALIFSPVVQCILMVTVFWPPLIFAQACALLSKMTIPPATKQVVLVLSPKGSSAVVHLCQRHRGHWQRARQPAFAAMIGQHGIAARGEKREGDLKTPAGFYALGEAFGTSKRAFDLDYRLITADDKWIDDPLSAQYNQWVFGHTTARHYETMRIKPYQLGIIIRYNMDPVISGAGSGIFIHGWWSKTTPTAGCIALHPQHVETLLMWLHKDQHPGVYIRRTKS